MATISPNKRPFSLIDPNISFPHVEKEKVSTVLMGICGAAVPMAVIFLVTFLLVPGPTVSKSTPKALIWRRKLWEWHTGWLGLGLSLASAFLITQGMKNLFGKPRPDLLSRCDPDLANIDKYALGSSAHYNVTTPNQNYPILVSAAICRATGDTLEDGFRSFPSGHASFSSAGLIYLSLYLASKLAISMPYLSPRAYSSDESHLSAFPSRAERRNKASSSLSAGPTPFEHDEPTGHNDQIIAARNEAAAPPVYLLAIAIVPWFTSIYITATRWSDFRHHGFDLLFGYTIGLITAIFAFRYYHLPIRQGAGWSWGPRSRDRSFWAGIGVGNYAGSGSRVTEATSKKADIETGGMSPPTRRATNDVGATEESKARDGVI